MSQKFYSLQRVSEGKKLFISKEDMNVLTDNPEDALRFFSENHVEVWKKCNPTFTDVTMVEMLLDDDGTVSEISRTNEEIVIEEMTRKFVKRNGEEVFRSFANTIIDMMHSDKWSVTYDWMHENFTFLPDENDGQIITKFVELVKTNRL